MHAGLERQHELVQWTPPVLWSRSAGIQLCSCCLCETGAAGAAATLCVWASYRAQWVPLQTGGVGCCQRSLSTLADCGSPGLQIVSWCYATVSFTGYWAFGNGECDGNLTGQRPVSTNVMLSSFFAAFAVCQAVVSWTHVSFELKGRAWDAPRLNTLLPLLCRCG